MNFITINTNDMANGTGFRISLFVAGCRNKCKGCFNQESWDFNAGTPFSETTKSVILEALTKPEIEGITILGGEPLEPENQPAILDLLTEVKNRFPEKNVWLYTGRTLRFENETIVVSSNYMEHDIANTPMLPKILSLCDIIVDGPFVEELKSTAMFRGSSNQRLISMKESMIAKQIITWKPTEPEVKIF